MLGPRAEARVLLSVRKLVLHVSVYVLTLSKAHCLYASNHVSCLIQEYAGRRCSGSLNTSLTLTLSFKVAAFKIICFTLIHVTLLLLLFEL